MASRSFIQFTYAGKITDGNRSANTLCTELHRIVGYLDIISPSVRATALGCTFSLLLNQRDFCFLVRRDNILKFSNMVLNSLKPPLTKTFVRWSIIPTIQTANFVDAWQIPPRINISLEITKISMFIPSHVIIIIITSSVIRGLTRH